MSSQIKNASYSKVIRTKCVFFNNSGIKKNQTKKPYAIIHSLLSSQRETSIKKYAVIL
jgi:hypothetical protein